MVQLKIWHLDMNHHDEILNLWMCDRCVAVCWSLYQRRKTWREIMAKYKLVEIECELICYLAQIWAWGTWFKVNGDNHLTTRDDSTVYSLFLNYKQTIFYFCYTRPSVHHPLCLILLLTPREYQQVWGLSSYPSWIQSIFLPIPSYLAL